MKKTAQINSSYAFIALLLMVGFQWWWAEQTRPVTIAYSEFEKLLDANGVAEVWIRERLVQGRFTTPRADGRERFVTTRVEPTFAAHLAEHGVEFSGVVESTWLRDVLSWILPTLFFVAVWLFLIRRVAARQGFGGLISIGARAKVYVERSTGVTFDDVAGVDEAKAELKEIVDFLKSPQDYGLGRDNHLVRRVVVRRAHRLGA